MHAQQPAKLEAFVRAAAQINDPESPHFGRPQDFDDELPTGAATKTVTAILEAGRVTPALAVRQVTEHGLDRISQDRCLLSTAGGILALAGRCGHLKIIISRVSRLPRPLRS